MFEDRLDGGRRLARLLEPYRNSSGGIILALPRGGVVVGFALHEALGLPLDVFITRKLRARINPEYALGALTETGYRFINPEAAEILMGPGDEDYVSRETAHQREEIEHRKQLYRRGRSLPVLAGRTVLLVDDGLATGSTMTAAVRGVRALEPGQIVVAVPVAAPESLRRLEDEADAVVAVSTPDRFMAVGEHYLDFPQVEDREVQRYLELADQKGRGAP